ncbi:AAA family ATPase [Archangium sp.]|uniref:AAA family ATPase n=1 Tax=Archangium sp. TaxID=1872627 RepID=UPI00286BA0A5|nr:AAA family ATPase [Archangium sp.]
MVKLKRLKIGKYRNVKPGTELHFRDSLNVMLGRNGTGKTTLLNLIVQLLSWDFSQLQNEAADLEYVLETPGVGLTVRVRTELLHEPAGLTGNARKLSSGLLAMGLVQRSQRYAMTLGIEIVLSEDKSYVLSLEGSRLILAKKGEPPFYTISPMQVAQGESALVAMIIAALEGEGAASSSGLVREAMLALGTAAGDRFSLPMLRRFDESLEYLGSITQEKTLNAERIQEGGKYHSTDVAGPPVFARRLMDALNQDAETDEIRIESNEEEAEFLARLVVLLGFESAQARLHRISRSSGPDEQVKFGNVQFHFVRRDKSITNHSLLSYGQKRLLAFYCYLASSPTCVVADELVNGMHHEWIDACLKDLGERQAFLTSQNPLLLDYLCFDSAEEVRSSFVLCHTEFYEAREQMVWENMSLDEAVGFFSAYQVAIHHVGELLRLRGLW